MVAPKIDFQRIFCLLLLLLPSLFSLAYLYLYGVNVPYLDQWEIVPLFEKFFVGTLHWSELFAPHNEHMIFFPRLLMLSLGLLSHYNILLELFANWVLSVGTAVLILLTLYRETKEKFLWAAIPLSFLLFNLKQFSLLEGFNIAHHMEQFFSVLSLYLLAQAVRGEHPWKHFYLALGSAVIASLSALGGMLVWAVGFLPLSFCKRKRAQKKLFFAWAVASLTLYSIYFTLVGGNFPLHTLPHFSRLISFALELLGNSLYLPHLKALLGFLLVLLAFAGAYLSKHRPALNPFWLSLILYAFLVTGAITFGRSNDPAASGWNHYIIYTLLAPAGLYGLFCFFTLSQDARTPPYPFYFILFLLLISIPADVLISRRIGRRVREQRLAISYALLSKNPSTYLLEAAYPNPKEVKKRALILKKLHYSLFAPSTQRSLLKQMRDRNPP